MKPPTLNIYKYTCYRAYLCAFSEEKKAVNPSWSHGAWAKKLGLAGTASLTMILNGQRNPGKGISQKFVDYFNFNKKESQYFQDLIMLEKSKNDPRLSVLLMEKLNRQSPHSKFIKVEGEQFRTLSKWYYYAIREMIHLNDFRENADWIVSRLNYKVTPREVKKAIQDLLVLGLLERDKNQQLSCSYGSIDTESDIANEYIKRFHEQMISHARDSIRKNDVKDRSINAMTLTVNQQDLPKAKALISKFQDDLCKLLEADKGDSIYQCNIQLFPLTREGRG